MNRRSIEGFNDLIQERPRHLTDDVYGALDAPRLPEVTTMSTLQIDAADTQMLKIMARHLAAQRYQILLEVEVTTTGEELFIVWHPAFDWQGIQRCLAQGITPEEAVLSLADMRYALILHLLENNLPVPLPDLVLVPPVVMFHSKEL